MMGSGKTTVGRKVARQLGRVFVDTDEAVVSGTGRSVEDWFAAGDEVGFRDAEERVLAETLSRPEPLVVATGGGVVLRAASRARLREQSNTVVWLRASPAFLADRVTQ
jgi:shikimate kinase